MKRGLLLLLVVATGLGLYAALSPSNSPDSSGRSETVEPTVLPEADRVRLWDVENRANVLNEYGWSRLKAAIRSADTDALRLLAADSFESLIPGEALTDETPDMWSGVTQFVSNETAVSGGYDQFANWLLSLRKPFSAEVSVSIEQLAIDPQAESDDALWESRIRFRLRGLTADGQCEVLATATCKTGCPERELLEQGSWLQSWQTQSVNSVTGTQPLMVDVTEQSGIRIDTLHDNWSVPKSDRMVTTGGVYLSDFNRDGCTDVLVTDANPLHPVFLYAGNADGTFRDVTAEVQLPSIPHTQHALWADVDGDGWEDLLFPGYATFRNHTGQRFVDMSGVTTLNREILRIGVEGITGMSVADYDRDGRVDLYVTRGDSTNFNQGSWIDGTSGNPPRNQLLRNLGGGQFVDITEDANASGGRRSVFTAQWLDANNDAWPDLYVIHEFGAGVLLVNQQDGTFTEHLIAPSESSDFGSMGQAVGDVNNDGQVDLYVSNMYSKAGNRVMDHIPFGCHSPDTLLKLRRMVSGSQLHLNQGDLKFTQTADDMGVAQVGWSWGAAMADLNNDGWLDIHATAGFMSHDRNEPDG